MKKFLWILMILILGGLIYGLWMWNKPHRDIAGEEAKFEMKASELAEAFVQNEQAANRKYVDMVVELKGVVAEAADDHIRLESGIYCQGDFATADVEPGDNIELKGRVISFDELFEEVRMDNCTLE